MLLLLHFLEKSLRVQLYFPIWRVLQLPVGKEKKSIQAWFEKLNRAGNRTVFRWLADEVFQKKVEEFRRSKIVTSDAKSIYGMLLPKDRKELLTLLLDEKENRHLRFPEIAELESKIMQIAENDHDPLQKATKGAVEKVERFLGRLRRNALFSRDYETDGSPIKQTRREIVVELMEMAIIAAGLGEDKELARAVGDICNQIDRRMGEDEKKDEE